MFGSKKDPPSQPPSPLPPHASYTTCTDTHARPASLHPKSKSCSYPIQQHLSYIVQFSLLIFAQDLKALAYNNTFLATDMFLSYQFWYTF